MHSRNLLRNGTVLGSFKLDVGTVYATAGRLLENNLCIFLLLILSLNLSLIFHSLFPSAVYDIDSVCSVIMRNACWIPPGRVSLTWAYFIRLISYFLFSSCHSSFKHIVKSHLTVTFSKAIGKGPGKVSVKIRAEDIFTVQCVRKAFF